MCYLTFLVTRDQQVPNLGLGAPGTVRRVLSGGDTPQMKTALQARRGSVVRFFTTAEPVTV